MPSHPFHMLVLLWIFFHINHCQGVVCTNTSFQRNILKWRWRVGFVPCLLWRRPEPLSLSAAKSVQSSQSGNSRMRTGEVTTGETQVSTHYTLWGCLPGTFYSKTYWLTIIITISYLHAERAYIKECFFQLWLHFLPYCYIWFLFKECCKQRHMQCSEPV